MGLTRDLLGSHKESPYTLNVNYKFTEHPST
jgi:hypothetical protein